VPERLQVGRWHSVGARVDWFNQHLLTIMILLPVAGAAALAFFRPDSVVAIRRFALAVSLATLAFAAIGVTGRVLQGVAEAARTSGLALEERANWFTDDGQVGRLQIQYAVGLDGISLPLVLLTALLTPLAILASFSGIRERVKEYYALLLLLHASMLGVFCARDLLVFYVFFESPLIPLYFIIAIWGGSERRKAANTFFIYTLSGSLLTFAGVLYLGWLGFSHAGSNNAVFSFDMARLYD